MQTKKTRHDVGIAHDRLSDAEFDIMHVLWHSDVALSAGDVVRLLSDSRNWKTQTAHVLLNRLLDKGYIEVDKSGYTSARI